MAQDLGLHRDPAGWMNDFQVLKFSREEVEVRRRTWWAVYIVDKYTHESNADFRYISAWQGRPTTIINQDFDTQFPEDEAVCFLSPFDNSESANITGFYAPPFFQTAGQRR